MKGEREKEKERTFVVDWRVIVCGIDNYRLCDTEKEKETERRVIVVLCRSSDQLLVLLPLPLQYYGF